MSVETGLPSRQRYWRTSAKVGLVTGPSTPSAAAKPWAKVVLPAPRSPTRRNTSPARLKGASRAATARVASADSVTRTPFAFTRSRPARQQPLGAHQVRPHLGHGLAAAAQDVGGVVGRDEMSHAAFEHLAA